jgi:hypothetical protein
MVFSGMLHHVALVRTNVSGELSASFIEVTRIGELGTMLVTANVVPSSPILVTLMKEAPGSSETSVLTRATHRNVPEDAILHSHHRENLKSYNGNSCNSSSGTVFMLVVVLVVLAAALAVIVMVIVLIVVLAMVLAAGVAVVMMVVVGTKVVLIVFIVVVTK